MDYQHLEIETQHQVATIWINRPEVHNAFNNDVIEELSTCFKSFNDCADVRVIILAGRGKNFSAGADLNWMKQAGQASTQENETDALKLAQMFENLANLKQPTIARVQGIALGGGMGLAATCDICIASNDAQFATSEVRLGLAPSTISPYVIRAIGARQASRFFLTAERIKAEQAQQIGLVHEICTLPELDQKINSIVQALLLGAPFAQTASKQLIQQVADKELTSELQRYTAQHIAHIRQGTEAKAGLTAFLTKQSPPWIHTTQ